MSAHSLIDAFLFFKSTLVFGLDFEFGLELRKCLLHRFGFGHQIASAPAAYYIVFFSLIRFKYSTLTLECTALMA